MSNLFINIIILLLFLFQQKDYPLRKNRPTTEGINLYVKENTNAIIAEFQKFIGDTLLLDTEFSTDNLSLYTGYDTLDNKDVKGAFISHRKGKSLEEEYGIEKANEIKMKLHETHLNKPSHRKGKSLEEEYGIEKANETKT